MFSDLIVQPIFNLLVLIYALLPGHNFGVAIILFTVLIRLLMWPLVRKQLHQVKKMRKIQPELKRIKKAAAGDKRKEQAMVLELYKEKGINPFGQIGTLLIQIPILLGLYMGLQKVLKDPEQLVSFAYPFFQDLSWLKQLAHDIHSFDSTLFGLVDLTRPALGPAGLYWPALLICVSSAIAQYFQSKQLAPASKDARSLRTILSDARQGKQADQSEVNAAMGRNMMYLLPALVLLFTINLPCALSLYWLVSGIVAYIQQGIILREDTVELETSVTIKQDTKVKANEREKQAVEAEIVDQPKKKSTKKPPRKKRKKR
jgi:YidC/Oxa1 family membrane protein insertase